MAKDFSKSIREFLETDLDAYHKRIQENTGTDRFLNLTNRVPAYASFLQDQATAAGANPVTNKPNYITKYPLADRCLDGRLEDADIFSVSSGTTGQAVMWPRSLADEARCAYTFEAIFRNSFKAHEKRTLALVCFPLGIWVGGLYTISALRLVAQKGYSITALGPGTNVAEIRRCLTEIALLFDQTVICGYPPFIRDVISQLVPSEVDPNKIRLKLLLAGEAFSEAWRDDMGARLGFEDRYSDCISMYGTADSGVLAFETAATIKVRENAAATPGFGDKVWGRPDTPALFQYQPDRLVIEPNSETITLWSEGVHPLFRYDLNDVGTSVAFDDFSAKTGIRGGENLPFVYQFGRRDSTVSFFGGQVYPEHIAAFFDRSEHQLTLTGRFTILVDHVSTENKPLTIVVESRPGQVPSSDLAEELEAHLLVVNSEYANYVPKQYQRPNVIIADFHDPRFFERGKKQVYIRSADS